MDTEPLAPDVAGVTDDEIAEVTEEGITLKNRTRIDFAVCAQIWDEIHADDGARCVGDRDADELSFTFYALPNPVTVRFDPKGCQENAFRRFLDLQERIVGFGYTTYDMTWNGEAE